jgi:GNAT superfamily N-acetyltransferase
MAVRIAPASSAADLARVAAMFRDYAASLGIDLAYQDFEREVQTLPGAYAPPAGALLLAWSEADAPLGCVGLRPMRDDGACEMKRLYVTPQARGLGVGRALLEAVLTEARRLGYREMRLDTLPTMHAAIAMYRQSGFVPIEPYYDTAPAGTLFLSRLL